MQPDNRQAFLFSNVIVLLLTVNIAYCQLLDEIPYAKDNIMFSIGGTLNSPGGDWSEFAEGGIGINAEWNYFLSEKFSPYVATGYLLFTGKTLANYGIYGSFEQQFRVVPLHIGAHYFIMNSGKIRPVVGAGVGGNYITSQIETRVFLSSETTSGDSEIEFSYQAEAGVAVGKFLVVLRQTMFNGGRYFGLGISYSKLARR